MYEDSIKQSVSLFDAFERYGVEVNQHRYAICPFHDDRSPSMGVFANGTKWKCFACESGGDVIDLVSGLFNLSHNETLQKINDDFGLNLPISKRFDKDRYKTIREEQRRRQAEIEKKKRRCAEAIKDYWQLFDAVKSIEYDIMIFKPVGHEEPSNLYLSLLARLDYLLSELDYAEIKMRRAKAEVYKT